MLGKKLSDSSCKRTLFAPESETENTTPSPNATQTTPMAITRANTTGSSTSPDKKPNSDSRSRRRSSSCPGDPQRHSSSSNSEAPYFKRRKNSITPDKASTVATRDAASVPHCTTSTDNAPVANLDDQNEVKSIFTKGLAKLEANLIAGLVVMVVFVCVMLARNAKALTLIPD